MLPYRGHVPFDAPYSVGHWLRDLAPLLQGALRPGWSGAFKGGWTLYLDGAIGFGDDQDVLSLEFTLQRSF